jgi:hypothetical protein
LSARGQPDRHVTDNDESVSFLVACQVAPGEAGRGKYVVVEKEDDLADSPTKSIGTCNLCTAG